MTDGAADDWLVRGGTDPDEIAERYDRWAEAYDADLDSWSYRAPDVVADVVVRHLPPVRTVLDAGCGTGLVGRALRAAGYTGTIDGVDLSAASIELAGRSGFYRSLAVADLQQPIELPDASFDALVCVGVMTYVPDTAAAWREFARLVRPGGLVVVTQREDLWEERNCRSVADGLSADGVWQFLDVTEPQPYLPDNTDGMAPIGVRYLTARVR